MSNEHNEQQRKKALKWLRTKSKKGYLGDAKHTRAQHEQMVDALHPQQSKLRSVK